MVEMPMVNKEKGEVWELMVDGSSNKKGTEVGNVLKSCHGEVFKQSLKLGFKALITKLNIML